MHFVPLPFRHWQTVGLSLPFDSSTDKIDEYNQEIQQTIEYWEHRAPDEALRLAQLKLDVNRRFYRASHAR